MTWCSLFMILSQKYLWGFTLPSYPPIQHIVKLLPLPLKKLGSICTTCNHIFSLLISGQQSQWVQFQAIKLIFPKVVSVSQKTPIRHFCQHPSKFFQDESVMQLDYLWTAMTNRIPFAFWCSFDFDALSLFYFWILSFGRCTHSLLCFE